MSALYGFAYTETALLYLETLRSAKLRRQIRRKIEMLATNPLPATCKKLHGVMDGTYAVYRIRSGDYRILYSVRGIIVVILDIDHRKDVYR